MRWPSSTVTLPCWASSARRPPARASGTASLAASHFPSGEVTSSRNSSQISILRRYPDPGRRAGGRPPATISAFAAPRTGRPSAGLGGAECLRGQAGHFLGGHVAHALSHRPAMPERVDELPGALPPERLAQRLEDLG